MSGSRFVTSICCQSNRECFISVNAGKSDQGVRWMVEFESDQFVGGWQIPSEELESQQAGSSARFIRIVKCRFEFAAGGIELVELQQGNAAEVVDIARTREPGQGVQC